jgi:hypothetical protein
MYLALPTARTGKGGTGEEVDEEGIPASTPAAAPTKSKKK